MPYFGHWNDDWKFRLGIPEGGDNRRHFWKAGYTLGPGARVYNDTAWKTVTLPHDWGMELDYDYTVNVQHGAAPIGEGVHPNPIGFYRKTFFVPTDWADETVSLRFEGVFRDCEILVNGQYVTRNLSGYTGFTVELDDLLFYGEVNSVAVRVDATQAEGWFYEGAGIYRNVWMRRLPRIHIDPDTVFLRLDDTRDDLLADFEAVNETDSAADIPVSCTVDGKTVSDTVTVAARSRKTVTLRLPMDGYHAWDIDDPYLYPVQLCAGTHTYDTRTGLRRIRFDVNEGFFLNGRSVKLLGSCTHQDFAISGSALSDDFQRYKMSVLKQYGFNSIRTSHNTPSPVLLDACDELGLLVMSETRFFGSTPEGMHQMRETVLEGRSHPCVILWSIGNEEIIQQSETSARQARRLCDMVHGLDSTRLTTYAGNNAETLTGINPTVDVRGVNYIHISRDLHMVDRYHENMPNQPMVGSEESSALASRSVWHSDLSRSHTENFDNCGPGYALGAEALWNAYMERPYLAGAFVWTGIDYRGEASKQGYITNFGVIDLCGFPKSSAHYYRAVGNPAPYLYMYPDWNRKNADGSPVAGGTPVDIIIYTNAASVELFLNGKSFGKLTRAPYASLKFTVPYERGCVTAVGFDADDTEILREEMYSYGAPVKVVTEETEIGDTRFVRYSAVDADGHTCEDADIRLDITAPVGYTLLGAANGDPSDPDGELVREVVPTLALKGFRVHELPDDRRYTDQNLSGIIGNTDPERIRQFAHEFADESDATYATHKGPRRKVSVERPLPDEALEITCRFWLDADEAALYRSVVLGTVFGRPEFVLNGVSLTPAPACEVPDADAGDAASLKKSAAVFDGCGDAVRLDVSSALHEGENTLTVRVTPDAQRLYAVGHGVRLEGCPEKVMQKRLWNGRALAAMKKSAK